MNKSMESNSFTPLEKDNKILSENEELLNLSAPSFSEWNNLKDSMYDQWQKHYRI
jgi:hypothetical protein